jgi:hypothetical protein
MDDALGMYAVRLPCYGNCRRCVCAIVGDPPSGGVSVELGWASAMAKPVLIVLSSSGGHTPLIAGLDTVTRASYLDDPGRWDAAFGQRVIGSLTVVLEAPEVEASSEVRGGSVGRMASGG